MKRLQLFFLAGLIVFLAGCVSPAGRRADYLDTHPELSEKVSKAISSGELVSGMTMDEVRASWGEPDMITKSVSEEGVDQIWSYDSYHENQENQSPVIIRFGKGRVTSWVE